jgi:hypothetical protein
MPINIEKIGIPMKSSPTIMIAKTDGIPRRLMNVLEDFFSDIVQFARERKFTGTLKLMPNRLMYFRCG